MLGSGTSDLQFGIEVETLFAVLQPKAQLSINYGAPRAVSDPATPSVCCG